MRGSAGKKCGTSSSNSKVEWRWFLRYESTPLQGASLFEMELALRGGLGRAAAAAAAAGGLGSQAVEVAVESTPEASGHVAIHLACPADPQVP